MPSLTHVVCDSNEAKFPTEKLVMDTEVLIWIILKCLSFWIFRTCFNNTYRRNWSFRSLAKKRLLDTGSLHYGIIWSKFKGPDKSHILYNNKRDCNFWKTFTTKRYWNIEHLMLFAIFTTSQVICGKYLFNFGSNDTRPLAKPRTFALCICC